jgi:predicted secreted protein
LPKISVPDLADDAVGLSAEALAQVPTLTEQVDDAPGQELLPSEPVLEAVPEPVAPAIQAQPAQADTWGEVLHARMGKLNGDIQTLNVRLDRLEERNKSKA